MLMPLVEKDVKRMYDAKIKVPLRYSKWVSNLVPTRKKTGEIRFHIDSQNLNKASLKEKYPLPKMDHILYKVVRSSRISLLYSFSSHNQVLVHLDDEEKTIFTTPSGTFMYVKMIFCLMNAATTLKDPWILLFLMKWVISYLYIKFQHWTNEPINQLHRKSIISYSNALFKGIRVH